MTNPIEQKQLEQLVEKQVRIAVGNHIHNTLKLNDSTMRYLVEQKLRERIQKLTQNADTLRVGDLVLSKFVSNVVHAIDGKQPLTGYAANNASYFRSVIEEKLAKKIIEQLTVTVGMKANVQE